MFNKNLFKNRINLINYLILDLILYLFLNLILYGIINLEITNLYRLLIWIFVSYIFDRYHLRSFKFIYVRKYIFKTFIIYLFLSLINYSFGSENLLMSFYFFSSILIQFLYLQISLRTIKRYKKWLTNDINLMHTFNTQPFYFRNNKLFFFESNLNYDFSEFEGIILDDIDLPKNVNKLDKLKIFKSLDWCEIYLESFPLDVITNDILYKKLKNQNHKNNFFILRRILELVLSILISILLSPIILIFSILVFTQDGFPVFYSQFRKGKNNAIIKIFKIRSMRKDSELNGPQWSTFNDSRITFIGKFIRKTRIDELPQLWSVILGKLSLIGPRPERPEIDEILKKEIDFYDFRYLVKPGITGWAQVNYPYGASIGDSKIKQSYDLYYVKNVSIMLDFIIVLKTIRLILNGRGAIPLEKNN